MCADYLRDRFGSFSSGDILFSLFFLTSKEEILLTQTQTFFPLLANRLIR